VGIDTGGPGNADREYVAAARQLWPKHTGRDWVFLAGRFDLQLEERIVTEERGSADASRHALGVGNDLFWPEHDGAELARADIAADTRVESAERSIDMAAGIEHLSRKEHRFAQKGGRPELARAA